MTTRPSRTNTLDSGDLIVLYKDNDSDYRTISVPDFMDKVKDEISDTEFSSYYLRLDKDETLDLSDNKLSMWIKVLESSPSKALTVVLPSANWAKDGQEVLLNNLSSNPVSVFFGSAGASVIGEEVNVLPSLEARFKYDKTLKQWFRTKFAIGSVTTVVGKEGGVTAEDVSASLLTDTDLMSSFNLKTPSGLNQQSINDMVGAPWYVKTGGYAVGGSAKLSDGVIVVSTTAANTNNPNSNMIGWEIATKDKGVLTWSGRTQEDKNKDMITPLDYKAKGDGVTNDTQAFIDLELEYSGLIVDLLGKRYFVTQDFNKNKYTNGVFKIANERNVIAKTQYDHANVKFRSNCGNGYPVNEIVAGLGDPSTPTGTSLFQEFMYHPNTLSYYGTKEYSGANETELLTLVKYSSNSGKILSPVLTSNPSNIIGHQGLAHTREGAKTYFWTCGGSDIYAEKGRHVTKFEFNETTLNIENPKHFKLFGDEFVATATRVMDISPTYDTLIAVGSLASDLSLVCRVFKVSSLVDPSVDYSNSYTHQFPIKKPDSSLQSCMTDGEFAYFLHSTDLIKTCTVDIYTLTGANILTDDKCALGIDQSNSLSHKYWLAGSIFLTPDSEFGMIVGVGKKGGAGTQTPHSSYLMTTKIPRTRIFKNFGTNPAVFFDAPNSIGVDPVSSVKTVELNSDNTQRTRHELTQNIEYMYPKGATGGYSVIQATPHDARYYMENPARKGQLQISSSGNLGLWDGTFNKWILYSDPTGINLTSTNNILPSTTEVKTLGSNTYYWLEIFAKKVTYSDGVFDSFGTGSPESVVTASVGSTYRRTDGGAGSTLYVKESGIGNTGWIAK